MTGTVDAMVVSLIVATVLIYFVKHTAELKARRFTIAITGTMIRQSSGVI